MLQVAIVGCGKIADQHVHAIARIPGCRVVAVCDLEPLMARQLAERFAIPHWFADPAAMLQKVAPDVVHITTPPQSHFPLARQCLAAGCHVYLEKPFTVTAGETEELLQLATESNLQLTAGHNLQFTPEMIKMRELVAAGFLGGRPVHLESHFSYSLDDTAYVGPILGDRNHWVRRLPGQLLHNVISHPVAKLAEFLDDELEELVATAHQSPHLRNCGGQEVLDELRVLIRDRRGTTAYLCFSTQLRPGQNQLKICGPANSLLVDHASGCVVRHSARPAKSYLTYFLPPMRLAREHFCGGIRNIISFLRHQLHQDAGIKELVERFYASISGRGPSPIPHREIVLTARIMDHIFAQIRPSAVQPEADTCCARVP